MVAGHLQEKGGLFYAVLSYKDKNGKRCTKWVPTGLAVKGNKKRAEADSGVYSAPSPSHLCEYGQRYLPINHARGVL